MMKIFKFLKRKPKCPTAFEHRELKDMYKLLEHQIAIVMSHNELLEMEISTLLRQRVMRTDKEDFM